MGYATNDDLFCRGHVSFCEIVCCTVTISEILKFGFYVACRDLENFTYEVDVGQKLFKISGASFAGFPVDYREQGNV